jgi:phosphonate transport system substrate-binding protein
MENRRSFLKSAGAAGTIALTGLAGCSSGNGGDGTDTDGGDNGNDGDTGGDSTTTSGSDKIKFGGDGRINFGISPSVPQEDLNVQYAPLMDNIGKYVRNNYDTADGLNVKPSIGSNYSAIIQALGKKTMDAAETGPFAGALGVKTGNAEIILQRFGYGSWEYKSIIAVPKDSDITELSDLSGKTVAFSDRLSTSGCLYPLYSMSSQGNLDVGALPEGNGAQAEFDARFAGGHGKSYALLEEGQVDAAAMGGFIRDTGAAVPTEQFKKNARTLHEDTGLPRAPIVVSPGLSDEAKEAIKKAFLEAPEKAYYGADGKADTDDDLWFGKVREADKDTYQSVIDVANELGVGQEIFE